MENSAFKSSTDFPSIEDWREHVKVTVAHEAEAYTLAFGRTTLFRRFYELRNRVFPSAFQRELDRVSVLEDPERTKTLEALNGRIFADMISFLKEAVPLESESVIDETPREEVQRLLEYIGRTNPAFAVWVEYKSRSGANADATGWKDYVHQLLAGASDTNVEFTLLMSQLGELLHRYRDSNRALPHLHFQRIWFLHYIRTADRNLQARAIVQGLLEAVDSCTFA